MKKVLQYEFITTFKNRKCNPIFFLFTSILSFPHQEMCAVVCIALTLSNSTHCASFFLAVYLSFRRFVLYSNSMELMPLFMFRFKNLYFHPLSISFFSEQKISCNTSYAIVQKRFNLKFSNELIEIYKKLLIKLV